MCHHIFNWNIVACDVKQPISLTHSPNIQHDTFARISHDSRGRSSGEAVVEATPIGQTSPHHWVRDAVEVCTDVITTGVWACVVWHGVVKQTACRDWRDGDRALDVAWQLCGCCAVVADISVCHGVVDSVTLKWKQEFFVTLGPQTEICKLENWLLVRHHWGHITFTFDLLNIPFCMNYEVLRLKTLLRYYTTSKCRQTDIHTNRWLTAAFLNPNHEV